MDMCLHYTNCKDANPYACNKRGFVYNLFIIWCKYRHRTARAAHLKFNIHGIVTGRFKSSD